MTPPVALTIAGSDSSGGAGIQADLKTFAALGVFGTSAITAVTAQNTVGVHGIHPVPAEFVVAQVQAVVDDLPVASVKTGMLATAETVQAVADLAAAGRLPRLVVDPVMVASSGDRLLEPQAEQLYLTALLPHATVFTPNLREAELLLGARIRTLNEQREAARTLGALGPATVVVKGGHAVTDTADETVDVAWDGERVYELRGPRIDTPNNHGTGCTFASATAAGLATAQGVREAIEGAKAFVTQAIALGAAWRLGHGHGPLNHLGPAPTTAAHDREVDAQQCQVGPCPVPDARL
ncbi:bifunctional hydroxymethylpyrimidine kinase/phosphomethylpyrimidine kinase [Blastococcus sp. CT_GayMR20]|uniref:bifunctional hydroxymethylpyrimidine kinase/phosphomethylpyrimidine kinase n=1 Tax=Blastococcus sp. CT_GayMR20 TaxID=2559609 RepID=UPI0010738896|nr:bifunctional hydroxymethylpyrimidine kinase/phosphomethylpyrimidine kinase [Blastococcus sp. CT_GayMR20]TFV87107.1 bifunctional hydroxymethylpyrimidine kinase/phosphomethylpyrimidine kinase [Blastococcus sp. CT_GayMR20]